MSASKPFMALPESLLLGQQLYYGLFSPSVLKVSAKMVKLSEKPTENGIKEVSWTAVPGLESMQKQNL